MDLTQGQTDPEERSGAAAGGTLRTPASAPAARLVSLTAGEFTLAVNPVDGSEIEALRPGTDTSRPAKRDAASRAARDTAARPPALPGPPILVRPLFGREQERDRLVRLLGRGHSVRLTGPAGSGRTALLDAVAARCADLAPDGVVRLSGHGHQQPGEVLQALYSAVYEAPRERPDRIALLARVRDIGAIVLLDDLDMGAAGLDELLRATPECAYLLASTPEAKAAGDDAHLEEVFLDGLGKAECTALLEAGVGRPLTDPEVAWAADLRFASEGLPLRFVQAAALLRQRDELNHSDEDDDGEEPGVFEERQRGAAHVPLPTLAEGAAPAELLASRVSESARAALRIACALGGEMPHHTHLPALVGDTHADAAVAELLACGLLTPVGARYRLAEGVARQLEEAGYGDTAAEEARTAARHYAWWTGHSSVTPERVAVEAEAVLAALGGADVVAAVLLARTAAPAFAASLHWEAWERVLRAGAEAARKAGEVAEQAYFHHELGVLALCEGRLDRARAELETSIGLRGALADKRGTVAGRRALALVVDREAAGGTSSPPLRLEPPAVPGDPAARPGSGGAARWAGAAAPAAPGRAPAGSDGAAAFPEGRAGAGGAGAPAGSAGGPGVPAAAAGLAAGPVGAGGAAALAGQGGEGGAAGGLTLRGPGSAGAGVPAGPTGGPGASGGAAGLAGGPAGADGAAAPAGPGGTAGAPGGLTLRGTGAAGGQGAAASSEGWAGKGGPAAAGAPTGQRGAAGSSGGWAGAGAPGGGELRGPGVGGPGVGARGGVELRGPAVGGPGVGRVDGAGSTGAVTSPLPVPVSPEAVTRVTPVVPLLPRTDTPTTLSAVFEDAFPLDPKPAAAPEPQPAAGRDAGHGRRRKALIAGAGALTAVVLGTVVSLAMSSEDTTPPAQGPSVSANPTRVAPSSAPGTTDPAAQPPVAPATSQSPTPGESTAQTTPGRTPSRKPSSTPSKSQPTSSGSQTSGTSPDPSPSQTSASPSATVSPSASATETGPQPGTP
ncbi:ATP-binding protein [Streptomyces sp. NPDC001717]|uniref:ATP-binding protein n=1 Tax=Streptomyces sp. NPDC001717 TaxID=3364604 RepID=UPI0036C1D146